MKVTRIETRPAPPPISMPYEVRIKLETDAEARLFWDLICHNLTVPEALVKAGYLTPELQVTMENFMQDICAGVRAR